MSAQTIATRYRPPIRCALNRSIFISFAPQSEVSQRLLAPPDYQDRQVWCPVKNDSFSSEIRIGRLPSRWPGHADARQVCDLPATTLLASAGLRPAEAVPDRRLFLA